MLPDSPYRALAAGLLLLGLAVRLVGLDKGIWLDEYDSYRIITSTDFLRELQATDTPPLYYILLRGWSFASSSEPWLRLFSVGFGMGTIWVTMRWAALHSRLAALLAGSFVATHPSLIRFSMEIRTYSILTFFVACAFYYASRAASRPQQHRFHVGLSASLVGVVSSHLIGVMVLPAVGLFYLQSTPWTTWRRPVRSLVAFAVPVVVFLLIYYVFFDVSVRARGPAQWWIPAVTGDVFWRVMRSALGLSEVAASMTPVLLLGGLALLALVPGSWRRSYPFLVVVVLFWLELIVYSVVAVPVFWFRTILPSLVPLACFLGVQLASIRHRFLRVAGVVLLLCYGAFVSGEWVWRYAHTTPENYRAVARLMEEHWTPAHTAVLYPGFVAGPIGFYLPELEAGASMRVGLRADIGKIRRLTKAHVARVRATGGQPAFFVVVRLAKPNPALQQMFRLLAGIAGKPSVLFSDSQIFLMSFPGR